jgi:hypothetical protein
MLDSYAFEELYRMDRELLDQQNKRRSAWLEREPRPASVSLVGGVRRRLAQVLLLLADRLDPRTVVNVPHVPASPALNGTLHHA